MTTFWAQSSPEGKFSLGTEYNAQRFKEFLRKNPNIRFKIEPFIPESRKQRGFFEGGVVKLITYYQEGLDYHDSNDCRKVRQWILNEFNGEFITIGDKVSKVAKSSKGELSRGLLENIIDWASEQGYQTELLVPEDYKYWRDVVFSSGNGPDNYIDYLLELKKLKSR